MIWAQVTASFSNDNSHYCQRVLFFFVFDLIVMVMKGYCTPHFLWTRHSMRFLALGREYSQFILPTRPNDTGELKSRNIYLFYVCSSG